jgi:hypothetical protein
VLSESRGTRTQLVPVVLATLLTVPTLDLVRDRLNDMPMLEFHEEFCASLCALMTKAWLPMDQWLVKEGRWVRPRNVALAANAFGDKIGKKGVAVSRRFDENFYAKSKPYSTLLNRAKLKRAGTRGLPTLLGMGLRAQRKPRGSEVTMPSVVVPWDISRSASIIQHAYRMKHRARGGQSARVQ